MPQVCRTCLEEIPDFNCVFLNNASKIREELRACLPEVDVELVPDAVMCFFCIDELHISYEFKKKCLMTEKQIRSQLHSLAAIDLAELKKDSEVNSATPLENDVSKNTEVVNGVLEETQSVMTSVNDDEDDEDDAHASNLVLGLCESAPRKSLPQEATTPVATKSRTVNNISLSISKQDVYNSARKSTTKSAQVIVSTKRKHARSNITVFKCSSCKSQAINLSDYLSHLKNSHIEENPYYDCPICDFNTMISSAFVKHYEIHTKINLSKSGATSQKGLFKCPHCDYKSPEVKALNKHIEESHILKCTKCYYVATNRTAYQKHISTHCLTLESDEVVVIDDDEDMQCNNCIYIAKGIADFEKHCLSVHNMNHPYVCKDCGYTANNKVNLNKHSQFHTGNRMFRCTFCTYNCDLLSNLTKHLTSRHNSKS